jgi:biopolymer transport protein ExbD
MNGLLPPRRRRVEMNLLPLIDVLVMLIFFAFVTMQFQSFTTLNITMPNIESAGKEGLKDPLEIGIAVSGAFSVRGEVVNEDQLIERVRAVAAASKDVPVLLRVDQDAPVKLVTRVMDICRAEKLNKIRLQSRGK